MLTQNLIHQPTISALARLGHGSQVLIADGNYPVGTAINPRAELVFLNFRAGLLDVDEVLRVLITAVPIESATVMAHLDGIGVPAHAAFSAVLGHEIPVKAEERFEFYKRVRGPDVGLVIATGDTRQYANLLLTIGVVG